MNDQTKNVVSSLTKRDIPVLVTPGVTYLPRPRLPGTYDTI
jgi:hypothetical protein